jgi:hypothetical protein
LIPDQHQQASNPQHVARGYETEISLDPMDRFLSPLPLGYGVPSRVQHFNIHGWDQGYCGFNVDVPGRGCSLNLFDFFPQTSKTVTENTSPVSTKYDGNWLDTKQAAW